MSEIVDGLTNLTVDSSSKKGHNVPIDHLDFEYVKKCDNVKELEKIYRVLISGVEGKYPDLEKTVENKIKILNPNSRVLRKDCPIDTRHSLSKNDKSKLDQEINDFINSIPNLEKEIAREKELTAAQLATGDSETSDDKDPPIRTKAQPILIKGDKKQQNVTEKQSKPSSNKNVKPKDYGEWAKIEKQLEKELENKEEKPEEKTDKKVEEPIKVTKNPDLKKLSTKIEPCDEKLRPTKAEQEKCKGNEAFNGKSYEEAVIYYTRSIQYVENNPAAYNNRAMAYIKLEKWDKAIDDCNSVFKYEPENVKAYFRRGSAYFHKRKFKDAKNDLELVVAKEANNKNAKELLAKINAELKKDDDERTEVKAKGGKRLVIEETDGESEEDESEEEKNEVKGNKDVEMTAQEDVKTVEVKEEKKKIIEIKETENDEDDESSQEEMSVDEPPKQEEPIQEVSIQEQQSTPSPPPPPPQPEVQIPQQVIDFKDNANKLFQNGQYSEAIEYYSKAIHHLTSTTNDQAHSNTLSILYSNRASCKQKIGSYKDAIGDCDMSLNFNKDNSKVLYKKAYSLELIEKYGDSLHEYEKLMRIDATHRQAQEGYNRVKKLLTERGHYKAKPRTPNNEENYEQQKTRGNEFVKINKHQEALECYTKCIEIDSKNPIAYLNRSLCYIKLNKPELAIQDCNYVLSVESNNVKGLYRRALAHKQMSSYQNAMVDLKTIISIEPSNLIAIKELEALKELVKNQPQPQPKPAQKQAATQNNKKPDQTNTHKEEKKPVESPKQNKPAEQTANKPKPVQQHKLPTQVTNSFEFLQAWNSINPNDIQSYCMLLEMIDANKLSAFIGSKLDGDMMCRLVSAFHRYLFVDYHENDTEDGYSMIGKRKFDKLIVYSYLLELSKAKRFDIVKSFLSNEYKKMLTEIFTYLEEQLKGNKTNAFYNSSDLESLKKIYN